MKHIKLFEEHSVLSELLPDVVSFSADDYSEFRSYCTKNFPDCLWDPIKSEYTYKQFTRDNGNFYIVGDKFLIQANLNSTGPFRLIVGADLGNYRHDLGMIINSEKCSVDALKSAMLLADVDKSNADPELLKNNIDLIAGYFKSHPTETYKLDAIPRIKREVIDRAGIKDYSRIGRNIRSGAIF
jgi:hypothetical protein